MEPISIFVIVGIAAFALSIKHVVDTCKTHNSDYDIIANNDVEIPPKYEDIDN